MKKYCLLIFVIFTTMLAYAALEDPYAHLVVYDGIDKPFLEHFANNKKTTYQVCTSVEGGDNEENHKQFLEALNLWLNTTEYYIKERENGEKDFADILKILRNVNNRLKRLPCKFKKVKDKNNIEYDALELNSNLNVVFALYEEWQDQAWYDASQKTMIINKYMPDIYVPPSHKFILYTITHELGHVFGLADRYDGNAHTGSYIYNSLIDRPSIMRQDVDEITCDDIDGFITSLDRIRDRKRTFKSFCNDDIILVNEKAEKMKAGKTYKHSTSFCYEGATYDANINIIYEDKSKSKKTYIMDLTLQNFEQAPGTKKLLKSLGFNINGLDLSQNIKVQIHAPVKELSTGIRLPIGLTRLTLRVNNKINQVVNMFYNNRSDSYIRTSANPFKTEIIMSPIQIPLMHYAPDHKEMEKITIIVDGSVEDLLHILDMEL